MNVIGICGYAGSGKNTVAGFIGAAMGDRNVVSIALADPMKSFCQEIFGFSDDQLWGSSEKRNEPDKRYVQEHRPAGITCIAQDDKKATFICARRHLTECPLSQVPPNVCPQCPSGMAEPIYLTPRHALQRLGTEWGRACYRNVWIDYALRTARKLLGMRAEECPVPQMSMCGSMHLTCLHQHCGLAQHGLPKAYAAAHVLITDVRFLNEAQAIKTAGGKVWRVARPVNYEADSSASVHGSEQEQFTVGMDALVDRTVLNIGTLEDLKGVVAEHVAEYIQELK